MKILTYIKRIFLRSPDKSSDEMDGAWNSQVIGHLYDSAFNGLYSQVETFLEAGCVDINAILPGYNTTLLVIAAGPGGLKPGGVKTVKVLLKAGADVNVADSYGTTPLHNAVGTSQNAEIAALLLEAGADVHAKQSGCGELTTALKCAEHDKSVELIEMLKNYGARE